MDIISPKEAKGKGLKKYFTGKSCKHGHIAARVVLTGVCCECLRLARIEYKKKNPERTRRDAREKYHRYKEREQEKARQKYKMNAEKINAYGREYRAKNKEKYRAYSIARYSRAPAEYLAISAARRAKTKLSDIPKPERELIKALYKKCRELNEAGGEKYHVDHIMPLSKGGKHTIGNLRIITASENCRKHSKIIDYPPLIESICPCKDP